MIFDRPEVWSEQVAGEEDAALDEAGTADAGACCQFYGDGWTAWYSSRKDKIDHLTTQPTAPLRHLTQLTV